MYKVSCDIMQKYIVQNTNIAVLIALSAAWSTCYTGKTVGSPYEASM